MNEQNHIPLPKDTPAHSCAECGAVSLDPGNLCKVQGVGTKVDWCGGDGAMPPKFCKNRVNVARHQCSNCGQTAINAQLLCEPEKLEMATG